LKLLQIDPFHPSLRTKKIKGLTIDVFECSVNMDVRILWRYIGTEAIIILDVGHHNLLDKM
jgi:mRNA interferase RelE/StbE